MEALKLSMNDIKRVTGESMPVLYAAIAQGHLRTFLCGRRRFARPEDVRKWVDHLQAESDAGRPVVYKPGRRQQDGGADRATE